MRKSQSNTRNMLLATLAVALITAVAPVAQAHNNQRDGMHRQAINRGRVAYSGPSSDLLADPQRLTSCMRIDSCNYTCMSNCLTLLPV